MPKLDAGLGCRDGAPPQSVRIVGTFAPVLRKGEGGPDHDLYIDLVRSTPGLARGFSRYPGDIGFASCSPHFMGCNVFSAIRLGTVELDNRIARSGVSTVTRSALN